MNLVFNDENKCEQWVSRQEGFTAQVQRHSIKKERSPYVSPCSWNTYLLFADIGRWCKNGQSCGLWIQKCPLVDLILSDQGMHILNNLPWNGGYTLFEKRIEPDNGARMIKVGDDYEHLWDMERWDSYDLNYMTNNLNDIVRSFLERKEVQEALLQRKTIDAEYNQQFKKDEVVK